MALLSSGNGLELIHSKLVLLRAPYILHPEPETRNPTP
jgi:hypothetical protein